MPVTGGGAVKMTGTPGTRHWIPSGAIGWWTFGLSVLALATWAVLPQVTMAFRDTYPITDSWVMPAINVILTDVAAVLSALCIWRWKERSALIIIAAVLTTPLALFGTLMVVGEALSGA